MKHLKWIVLVSAIVLLAVFFWKNEVPPKKVTFNQDSSKSLVSPTNNSASLGAQLVQEANKIDLSDSELPASLRGTEVDGGFRVDENGDLIVEQGIKRYFDYFMATVGEESIAEITARIHDAIMTQLEEPARSQALTILEDYLSYKTQLYELEQQIGEFNPASFNGSQLPMLASRLEAIFDARRTHLSAEVVDAFFSEDEAVDRYTLNRLSVLHDKALTEEERKEQLAQLEDTLPEDIRQQRAEVTQYQRYLVEETKLEKQNASPAEIHQLRSQEFGEEAAVRLAELDQKRGEWELRLKQYRIEKAQLDSSGLSQQDLVEQIEQLRSHHFSDIETRRVKALDRINGG